MSGASRRTFSTAGSTPPSADQPAAPAIPPPPAVSDIASKQASNTGHQDGDSLTYSASSLVAGFPEPRLDLVTVSWQLPRELAQAVDVLARTTRRARKDIVTDALYEHVPESLVLAVRLRLYPDPN